jgi:hypothetical protein
MSGFRDCQGIEARGLAVLVPFLERMAWRGRIVATDKGPLSQELQASFGDFFANDEAGKIYGIEVKCEEENRSGNFYLETWSNLNFDRRKLGWMYSQKADCIWYYFIQSDELFSIPTRRLFEWAFVEGSIYAYPERVQRKHAQFNVTAGRCVPIADIELAVGFKRYSPAASLQRAAA